jgi:hypothetical protein
MSDTCPVCGRYYNFYNEGHEPNSKTCLAIQNTKLRAVVKLLLTDLETYANDFATCDPAGYVTATSTHAALESGKNALKSDH